MTKKRGISADPGKIAARRLEKETGTVIKEPGGRLSVALAYPNSYEVGMSNLGFQKIYHLFNRRDDVLCERAFLPESTEIEFLKKNRRSLESMETGRALRTFDLLAFSITFEMDYLNVLTILDLAKIPFKDRAFDGTNAVNPILKAISSGHGIGKSTFTAWITLFILSTRPYARGIVTATPSDQLKTKPWAEPGKWHTLAINQPWFVYSNTKGNMTLKHVNYSNSWRADGMTCREENSESFSGLHAANSTPFYLFDEASGIPDAIWDVAEGGTTDGEPLWMVFGNPIRNTGRFRECFRKFRHRSEERRVGKECRSRWSPYH